VRLRRRPAERKKIRVPKSEDDHHREQQMEVSVNAAIGGSWEGKTSRRNRRRREKKSPKRIQRPTSVEEEERMTQEEPELWEWQSSCRGWSHILSLKFGPCEDTSKFMRHPTLVSYCILLLDH